MKKIIIDTPAFYALISSTDELHSEVKFLYERIIDLEFELWTTSYILIETMFLIYNRLKFDYLEIFVNTILNNINIYWIDEEIYKISWKKMKENKNRGLSFVDWTTIITANKLDSPVFTFDENFLREGIIIFPHHFIR